MGSAVTPDPSGSLNTHLLGSSTSVEGGTGHSDVQPLLAMVPDWCQEVLGVMLGQQGTNPMTTQLLNQGTLKSCLKSKLWKAGFGKGGIDDFFVFCRWGAEWSNGGNIDTDTMCIPPIVRYYRQPKQYSP